MPLTVYCVFGVRVGLDLAIKTTLVDWWHKGTNQTILMRNQEFAMICFTLKILGRSEFRPFKSHFQVQHDFAQ